MMIPDFWADLSGGNSHYDCEICDEPMEHTDRQAEQAEHDNDNAAIDAAMGDTE